MRIFSVFCDCDKNNLWMRRILTWILSSVWDYWHQRSALGMENADEIKILTSSLSPSRVILPELMAWARISSGPPDSWSRKWKLDHPLRQSIKTKCKSSRKELLFYSFLMMYVMVVWLPWKYTCDWWQWEYSLEIIDNKSGWSETSFNCLGLVEKIVPYIR